MNVRYAMRRITREDKLYGPSHGGEEYNITLCGQETDANWYVTHNNNDGEVTCKKCLRYLRKRTRGAMVSASAS